MRKHIVRAGVFFIMLAMACTAAQLKTAEDFIEHTCAGSVNSIVFAGYSVGAVGCGLAGVVDDILKGMTPTDAAACASKLRDSSVAVHKPVTLRGKKIGKLRVEVAEKVQARLDAMSAVPALDAGTDAAAVTP